MILSELGRGGMGVVYSAYDPELERKVAIKTITSLGGAGDLHSRTLHEAKALARLSHANVVGVYDVGTWCDRVWLAMELIEGHTLQEWLGLRPRSWRDIVRVLIAAGEGLRAAHEAGLVHGDFKPDNVMIDANERVRVMDFGLAHGSERAGAMGMRNSGELVQGTPAYMSPEQWRGSGSDPRSDLFSFSVTLYEALYGVRPFAGDTLAALWAQLEHGVVPVPAESRVPREVFRVVARGLATEPQQRWSGMAEMLSALSPEPGRVRARAVAMVGVLGAAGAGSFAVAMMGVSTEERCAAGAREIGEVWGEGQRKAVRQAFAQTGLAFAADVLAQAEERLDRYSEGWQGAHAGMCRAHAGGSTTARMLDLGNACLARNKQYVVALVDILARADRDVVENAVQAVAALPSVKACEDADELLNAVPPPDDPETAARVARLRESMARARILEVTGGYAEGLTLAMEVRGEAKTLGYAPLLAEAALVEGGLLSASARSAEAEAALGEALRLGIAHDLHAVAAEAAARRIFVLGDGLGRYEAAMAGETVAAALVERARDEGPLEALLENNLGTVFDLAGDDARAQEHFERTVTLLQHAGTPEPLLAVVYHNLANVDLERGDLEATQRNSTKAHDLFVQLLGEQHPMVAHPLGGLGDVALRQGALVEASARYTKALALMEAAHGSEHPYLLMPLTGLGHVAARRGDTAEARRRFEQVVALAERTGYVHPLLADALAGLGELAAAEGETKYARGLFERAVKTYGGDRMLGLSAALRAGEMAAKLGDTAAAISWFEQVLAGTPGPTGGDARRLTATLSLARMLAERGEARPRVCELLTEARAALAPGDERRTASDAAFVASCG